MAPPEGSSLRNDIMWLQAEREQYQLRVEKSLAIKRKQTVVLRNQAAAAVAVKGRLGLLNASKT